MFLNRYSRPAGALLIIALLAIKVTAAGATIIPAPPEIKATSYLVMDFNSGQILVEKNIDERVEPASLTKMMTTYIVTEEILHGRINLEDMVLISEKAWRMPGSRTFVEVGKEVSVKDLLMGVIIQSGNDASVALAEYIAGTEDVFAAVMNQYARDLGMQNTNFVNSTGLPHENHYTTARDLAILALATIRDHPEIYSWHAIREFTFNDITQPNRNRLLWRDDSVDGIKTGHTDAAGYCLVVSAKRDDMRLISVVMGADGEEARARASQSLLNFAFRFYETHRMYRGNDSIATTRVWMGETEELNLGIEEDLWVSVPRGQQSRLNPVIEYPPRIVAPVTGASHQGSIKVFHEDRLLAERPLIALNTVDEGGLFIRLKDKFRMFFE